MTVKHRGGAPAKPTIDLTKKAAPVMSKPPQAKLEPKQQQPRRRQYITAAADGPPIAAELPEKLHKIEGRVHKPRTDKQAEILGQIIEKAGDGIPRSLGLRLVLAASEHKYAAAWPIGLLAKAFHVSGCPTEANAVWKVAMGFRVSRYGNMAATALAVINEKLEAEAAPEAIRKDERPEIDETGLVRVGP
jgi:hypothetical protein